jgi:hypothetical protein
MQMNLARLSLLFVAVLVLGQPAKKADMVALGREFELKVGQTVAVEGERLTVSFDSVLADSRCPTGADCIWSGNAKIRLKVSKPGHESAVVELHTHLEPKQKSYLNYECRLIALKPYPKLNETIPPRGYQAVLKVSKR